jgi:hypothetical protein
MDVPGAGRRQSNNQFIYLKQQTYFWSSTPSAFPDNFRVRYLYSAGPELNPFDWHKLYAISCRCVKD